MKKIVSRSAIVLFAFAITLAGCQNKDELPAPPPTSPAPAPETPSPGDAAQPMTPPPVKPPDQKDQSKTK